ncbi:MAG: FlgD immunoglobulin-like domain containing protein, partial [Candidatus Eiseniibacteriota bacterium]
PPPPPPPPDETLVVGVSLSPASLNSASQGNWIAAQIVTDGWSADEIVVESLSLDGVAPEPGSGVAGGVTLTVKFPRAPFAARPNGEYQLALTGRRSDGVALAGSASLSVHGNGGGLGSHRRRQQPHNLRVVQNAGTRGAVAFSLEEPSEVTVDVLDPQGRTVARLARETLPNGDHVREWPAAGQRVPSGVYLVRLRAAGEQAVVRLALFR